jgi:RimJ/RimL family protein N-acetyltransferase
MNSILPPEVELDPDGLQLKLLTLNNAPAYWDFVEADRSHLTRFDPYDSVYNYDLPSIETTIDRIFTANLTGLELTRGLFFKDNLIGRFYVGLDHDNLCATLGWGIALRYQGRSFITRAGRFYLRHLFHDLGYVRAQIMCRTDNVRSVYVAEGLGLRHEGIIRNGRIIDGRPYDSLLYGMTDSDWHTLRPS